jgi:hypothetical protein
LTAADTNTYLANSGLVFVKQQTIGSGVASQAVTGAFSSTYDNYRIVVSGGTSSLSQPMEIKLGSTVTGYSYSLVYATYLTGTVTAATGTGATGTTIRFVGSAAVTSILCNIEILSPNLATLTAVTASYFDASNAGMMSGYVNNTTQYTDFTLLPSSGTLTGGTITVYGYRKG